ncbi:MAG TPA: prepilin-type N-terminal cleavage/methylation domain-containing protein [Methylotenera sp.]|nr:prepilin-type N-terminal cleavage/methylation domain-containing protein [Methylotenera sp.]HPH08558.1 prepilin-type N-terminal cleavage/methylation domain-containing protein [Methylotenera sp.]HPM48692.1 prepilin-type N-terminal cleavage/methylation domain-containing protein [Methylotenera sp.]
MSKFRGFTLIELLVSLVLLSLIISAAAPVLQLSAKRNKEQELKKSLWQIRDAIDAYKQAVDDGLIKKTIGDTGYPQSLLVLVAGVENIQDPNKKKIYFLRRIPRDPFATDDSLPADATWGKRSYASSFETPSEGDDVYDVNSKSHEVGINNQPYSEW